MQRYKPLYLDPTRRGTLTGHQECLRLTDLDSIDDGTHGLSFGMLGLFSFRELDLSESIGFWLDFLSTLGLKPDWSTIHPDRMEEWRGTYDGTGVPLREDPDCVWSDGGLGGFCTEMYISGVEIGNIVRTNGDCVDCGFGTERLLLSLGETPPDGDTVLRETILRLDKEGWIPGPKGQGYVLRRLCRILLKRGGTSDLPVLQDERKKMERLRGLWERLSPKHPDKDKEWWRSTHGIDVEDFQTP